LFAASLSFVLGAHYLCSTSIGANPQPKWHTPTAAVIVKPGKSVGALKIGMTSSQAHAILGKPYQVFFDYPRHSYPMTEIWCEKQINFNDPSFYCIVTDYRNGKIARILGKLPKAQLTDGFSLLSKFSSIKKKFKKLEYDFTIPDEDVAAQGYQDKKLGIAFFYGVWNEGVQAHFVQDVDKPVYFEVLKPGEEMSFHSNEIYLGSAAFRVDDKQKEIQ